MPERFASLRLEHEAMHPSRSCAPWRACAGVPERSRHARTAAGPSRDARNSHEAPKEDRLTRERVYQVEAKAFAKVRASRHEAA
jgi:hypothetical protein